MIKNFHASRNAEGIKASLEKLAKELRNIGNIKCYNTKFFNLFCEFSITNKLQKIYNLKHINNAVIVILSLSRIWFYKISP